MPTQIKTLHTYIFHEVTQAIEIKNLKLHKKFGELPSIQKTQMSGFPHIYSFIISTLTIGALFKMPVILAF
jgi:hypothetical protein